MQQQESTPLDVVWPWANNVIRRSILLYTVLDQHVGRMRSQPRAIKQSLVVAPGCHMEQIVGPIEQADTMLNLQSHVVQVHVLLQLTLRVRSVCCSGTLRGCVPFPVVNTVTDVQLSVAHPLAPHVTSHLPPN